MTLSDRKPPDPFSKSQAKRDMLALQKLGEALIDLSETQLTKIPLPEELVEAIQFARGLKAHEAKRRQLQYIGKLMREIDAKPIEEALQLLRSEHHRHIHQFHKIEKWRDRLITEGDNALQELLDELACDRQHVRQLVRNAKRHENPISSAASHELFRYLRDQFNK